MKQISSLQLHLLQLYHWIKIKLKQLNYINQEVFLYAGRFCFMPGLCSWKSQANRNCAQWTKNSRSKECIVLGASGMTSSSHMVYYYTTSVEYIHTVYMQHTYIVIEYTSIYLLLMQWQFKRLTATVFVTVHSNKTVIVLLHKQTL